MTKEQRETLESLTTPPKEVRVMIDLDELARLEREANAEQEAENAALARLDAGESVSVHDSVWAPTARDALIAAMRNALPELIEELRHLRLGPLAAMTARAERAEATASILAATFSATAADALVRAMRMTGELDKEERDAARAELAAMTEWKERERLRAEHGLESWKLAKAEGQALTRERDASRAEVERLRGVLAMVDKLTAKEQSVGYMPEHCPWCGSRSRKPDDGSDVDGFVHEPACLWAAFRAALRGEG